MYDSDFDTNGRLDTKGRALKVSGLSLEVQNSIFAGNNGFKEGGGIYASTKNVSFCNYFL